MSQVGIIGGKGGGKTYFAVELLYQKILEGRTVVTNIPLNIFDCPHLYEWNWEYLFTDWKINAMSESEKADFLKKFPWHGQGGVIFFLDECWRLQINLGSNVMKNEWVMSFFRETRQFINAEGFSNEIYLVSQDLDSIPARIRDLCDETVLCQKPTKIGVKNASIRVFMSGAVKGLTPLSKRITKTQHVFLKPEIYTLYKSHAMSENVGGGFDKESTVMNNTVFTSYKMKFLYPIAFIVAIYMVFSGASGMTSSKDKFTGKLGKDKENKQSIEVNKNVETVEINKNSPSILSSSDNVRHDSVSFSRSASSAVSDSSVTPDVINSKIWHLSGIIENKKKNKKVIYVSNDKHQIKKIDSSLCINDKFGQYSCVVEGEKISFFTGN